MTQRSNAADVSPLVSREQAGNAIGKALRLYVGRGRHYSVKQLSNGTGVKDRIITAALETGVDYRPLPVDALLSIATFLGADFTCEWLALAGQGAFDLPNDGGPDPLRMAVEGGADHARFLSIAADNEIGADEREEAAEIGRRKIARGMALVANSRRAA